MWKDLRYFIAYTAPAAAFAGLYVKGYAAPGSIYVGFVLIPLLELVLPRTTTNHEPQHEEQLLHTRFFDWLLYLNLPLVYGLLGYYFHIMTQDATLSTFEKIGFVCSVGLILGTSGINVAHELGHRKNKYERIIAKLLLMPSWYMHFIIEHNLGHHKWVATDKDPASSRMNEPIYTFWIRSVAGGYLNAWKLEARRLQTEGLSFFSFHNEMLRFTLFQLTYLAVIALYFGWAALPWAVLAGIFGFLMLESVNYIEHYGLRRRLLSSGHYEKVSLKHSWNSDHELGRIFLYELTRHSDHHYKASRKYQILRRFDESPQLPLGYPGSILLSLIPPLWFGLMNPRAKAYAKNEQGILKDALGD